jgi:hypothetical protein
MRPGDRVEFVRVLNGLAAIKGKDLTPEALDLWWSAMSRWSIEDFKGAASHLVTACQFMPSPYDFEQLRRADELTAGEAWVAVITGQPLDPDSRTARAVRVVGGQQHCRMANIERDLPHIQRRFMDVYEELSDVETTREALEEFGLRRLQEKVQGGSIVDEAMRPLLLKDEGSGTRRRGGFKAIL